MPHYQSFDPNTELRGQTVLALITNIEHNEIQSILRKHGLDQVDPAQWYNLQAVLDVLSDISDDVNASDRLVAIGKAAASLGLKDLPAEYASATPEQWLRLYADTLYAARTRNGDGGKLTLDKESNGNLILTTQSPYPDDLMYGLFYEYIRHFSAPGQHFVIRYDPDHVRHDMGGESTIYNIEFSA